MAGLRVPAKCLPVQRLPPSRRYRMSYLRRSTLSGYVSITLADRDRVSTSHAGTAVGRALDITGHDVTQLARPDGLSPQNQNACGRPPTGGSPGSNSPYHRQQEIQWP